MVKLLYRKDDIPVTVYACLHHAGMINHSNDDGEKVSLLLSYLGKK